MMVRPDPVSAAAAPQAGQDGAAAHAVREACEQQLRRVVLARQDPATGLLPASTAVTVHGDYTDAWVRDNVYSILAVWALSLAWRRESPERAQALAEPVVKLMRGLLAAMMRQSHKVERFKHTRAPIDALHAKYGTATGQPVVGDDGWGHLQLDATAVFLLFLAQMTASGLAIVETRDELDFVQNLVHYLSNADLTPDYGIWERGHKRNEGRVELNGSSIGMAKAALEAVDGLRPLAGAPAVHVCGDDVARMRIALEGLLPRESESKETDAALLAVIGFPAYAVDDPALTERTRADIVGKLQGRYGCKRFLRDGHQTVLEDHGRLYYEPGELRRFEHIECEWPLFFTYLLVDAAMRGDAATADDYRARLESLMVERDGERLLPELYRVPADAVAAERASPGSQAREPNENLPLVWAQSLYWVGVLLQSGGLTAEALNPRRRVLVPAAREDLTVRMALLATDELAHARLTTLGLPCDTLASAAPVRVVPAELLHEALESLGANPGLGLGGRLPGRLGIPATSHAFECRGELLAVLPSVFSRRDRYLGLDSRLLVDDVCTELSLLRRYWRHAQDPLFVLPVGDGLLTSAGAETLIAFLRRLVAGQVEGVRVAPLVPQWRLAERRRIDWIDRFPAGRLAGPEGGPGDWPLPWDEAATRPLSSARRSGLAQEADNGALRARLVASRNPHEQVELLALLWDREGPDARIALPVTPPLESSLRELVQGLYASACRARLWGPIRHAAGLLELGDDNLPNAVMRIVMHHKRVSVGRGYSAESIIGRPLPGHELQARLRAHGGADPRARMLIQETVLLLGSLVIGERELFDGSYTLRPWYLLRLITAVLAREHGLSPAEAFDHLLQLSPRALRSRLREVLAHEQEVSGLLGGVQHLQRTDDRGLNGLHFSAERDPVLPAADGDWTAWRERVGAVLRMPAEFHRRVWELLRHSTGLVVGDQLDSRNHVDSVVARADFTPAERGFALQIDDLLQRIPAPEYRQLTIEALYVLSAYCEANPTLQVQSPWVMDVIVGTAVRLGWREARPDAGDDYNEHVAAAWKAFYLRPPHQVANLVVAALQSLLAGTEGAAPPASQGPIDPVASAAPSALPH